MTTLSKHSANYALSWNVNQYNNWWYIGFLSNTASIIVCAGHGYSWTTLLNKRGEDKQLFSGLAMLSWSLINGIKALQH